MNFTNEQFLQRFQKYYTEYPSIGLALDLSRMNFEDSYLESMKQPMARAFVAMEALEKGDIANPDEKRMVGHYWLRNPALAPTKTIAEDISETLSQIKGFVGDIHNGRLKGAHGNFRNVLVVGIGGSALGPQFVASALGQPKSDKMKVYFFDNTDPDGMDKVLAQLEAQLGQTLVVVISKSGETKETRNGMVETKAAYEQAGLKFEAHAVAVTGVLSELDKTATRDGWVRRFPMWDWVGGRTSELSAVGLLPASLQGLDIDGILAGAKACDEITRRPKVQENPAAQLALMWRLVCNDKGRKDMVVLPYKDRLELFSKYLQQLVMESLGKEYAADNQTVVSEGIAVYGNKGSTDQHAYVQQLRDGTNNFFVTFIEVLRDREGKSMEVEPQVTSGDYLSGFFLGTRQALAEKGRESITITIKEVSPFMIGVLIALFERSVGYYASMASINAYHQPGVEAGKVAATSVIALQRAILAFLDASRDREFGLAEIANGVGAESRAETAFKVLEHLAANRERGIKKSPGIGPLGAKYSMPK